MKNSKINFWMLVSFFLLFFAVREIGCFSSLPDNCEKNLQETSNYHISQNTPVGSVMSEAQFIGEGLFLIQIQVDSDNPGNPKVYPAITAHPEQFPIGSKATMMNVTAMGKMTLGDAFHIAVKPGEKEATK